MFSTNQSIHDKRPWQLIGAEVISPGGDLIGTIEDVVLDKRSGGISEVVIGDLARPRKGGQFHRVSWYDLEYSEDDEAYVAPPRLRHDDFRRLASNVIRIA